MKWMINSGGGKLAQIGELIYCIATSKMMTRLARAKVPTQHHTHSVLLNLYIYYIIYKSEI